jgi:hypothetical protein
MYKSTDSFRAAFFLVLLVVVVFEISPTSNHNRKWPTQLTVRLVESLTPRTRTRTSGKKLSSSREFLQRKLSATGLAMVPFRIGDETVSLPSATTSVAETIIPKQKQLETRVAAILKFVDITILDSSLSLSRLEAETESIMERVRSAHREDFTTAKASYLEVEERGTGIPLSPFSFERIEYPHSPQEGGAPIPIVDTNPTLAIRSREPVLDPASVDAVREAAEDVWKADRGDDASTSRFTYQFSGNSEAHVFDFITTTSTTAYPNTSDDSTTTATKDSASKRAISALNEALQRKIYPTIREAFFRTNGGGSSNHGIDDDDGTRLFVYDALVIRYNSTKAAEAAEASGEAFASAGQPLHRDLGLVSVNIMLNSPEHFEGGGTFFENQLLGTAEVEATATATIQPHKPSGVGYCLAHSASERHAGAGTTTGVRDILVIFVSASTTSAGDELSNFSSTNDATEVPAEIAAARLKNCRNFCEQKAFDSTVESEEQWMEAQRSILMCRILHQRLAVKAGNEGISDSLLSPEPRAFCDGEALQYLGTALMEYSSFAASDHPSGAIGVLEVALECFEVASLVTPCDSRVYNNLGIVLGTIDEMERKQYKDKHGLDDDDCGGVVAAASTSTRRQVDQETAYRKGLDILHRSIKAGCTNESLIRDLDSLSLNYGLFVANQDRFRDAIEILEPVAVSANSGGAAAAAATDVGRDAYRLWEYCRDRGLDEHVQESVQ